MKGKILFQEEQGFIGTWMWYLLLGMSTFGLVPILVILFTQQDTNEAIIGLLIFTVVIGGVIALFSLSKLYITIDQGSIYYKYPPYINRERQLGKTDVKSAEVRTYSAIWEYGGYGYRYTFGNGRALNVSGDKGLQLELSSGKKLLLGTQKAEELNKALEQLKYNWENPQDHG
jgi:hypothetical protein